MTVRTRSKRIGALQTGTLIFRGAFPCSMNPTTHIWDRGIEWVSDDVLPGDGHYFETTKAQWSGPVSSGNGPNCSDVQVPRMINFCPQTFRQLTQSSPGHLTVLGKPTNGELAAQLLALTNPSRPVVDLPVMLGELPEFLHLARGYGDGFIKAVARGHLTYEFGIRPLISDLTALLNFQDEYAKRMRELNALREGTLRRKRTLFRGYATQTTPWTINSGSGQGGSIQTSRSGRTDEEVWGFVRWKPTEGFPKTDDALRRLARRAVLGLTVDFSTAWNLIPWSWLVDWCSSAGDYLAAKRNIIPCTPTGLVIMSRRTTSYTYTRTGGDFGTTSNWTNYQGTNGPWFVQVETKMRSPATATLNAHLPILSNRQLSILGSIQISKYRR